MEDLKQHIVTVGEITYGIGSTPSGNCLCVFKRKGNGPSMMVGEPIYDDPAPKKGKPKRTALQKAKDNLRSAVSRAEHLAENRHNRTVRDKERRGHVA